MTMALTTPSPPTGGGAATPSSSDGSVDGATTAMVPHSKWMEVVKKNKVLSTQVATLTKTLLSMDTPDVHRLSKKQVYAYAGGTDDVKGRLQNAEHYVKKEAWPNHKVYPGRWADVSTTKPKCMYNRVMSHVTLKAGEVRPVVWKIRGLPMTLVMYKNERQYSGRKMNEVHSGTSMMCAGLCLDVTHTARPVVPNLFPSTMQRS